MKTKYLLSIFILTLLTGCVLHDTEYRETIVGHWNGSTENQFGRSAYCLVFEKNGDHTIYKMDYSSDGYKEGFTDRGKWEVKFGKYINKITSVERNGHTEDSQWPHENKFKIIELTSSTLAFQTELKDNKIYTSSRIEDCAKIKM